MAVIAGIYGETEPKYVGCVISTYERNGYDDSDWYAICWDREKQKTIWAYLDDEKLVDVVQAALDNNMMVDDLKKQLIQENPGHTVTFKCEEG